MINPLAAISALQMLLSHIGERRSGSKSKKALIKALESGKIKSMSAG